MLIVDRAMIRLLSHAEQLAAHMRGELLRGRWQGEMPGASKLESELGVNHTTVSQALALLEQEGFLERGGGTRPRRIVLPKGAVPVGMKIGILLYDAADVSAPYVVDFRHRLEEEGLLVTVAPKSLMDLGMDVRKVSRLVRAIDVDAWLVMAASADVLRWFAGQPRPFIAFAGDYPRCVPLNSVAPGKGAATDVLLRRLISLGHRRIVFLSASGIQPQSFVKALAEHGIPVGTYHVPTMERSPEGLRQCIDTLFALTPPTALLIDEPDFFLAVQNQLGRRGLHAPEDVSLACMDGYPSFRWQIPEVTHIRWETEPIVRRIVEWAIRASRGTPDRKCVYTKAALVEGGTIGPAPKSS